MYTLHTMEPGHLPRPSLSKGTSTKALSLCCTQSLTEAIGSNNIKLFQHLLRGNLSLRKGTAVIKVPVGSNSPNQQRPEKVISHARGPTFLVLLPPGQVSGIPEITRLVPGDSGTKGLTSGQAVDRPHLSAGWYF